MKTCIISVAFREPYITHSATQDIRICEEIEEGLNCDLLYFRDQLPMKDEIFTGEDIIPEFQKSLYGFKPHAIQRAIDMGYEKVIWLDPSVLPTVSMQVLIDSLDENPMIVITGDAPITKMCSDKAFDWFELERSELEGVNHIGGTMYAFNFTDKKVRDVFDLWKRAEQNGIFGTQDEFMKGHWSDEACMVLAMHKCRMPQYKEEKFTYLNQKEI